MILAQSSAVFSEESSTAGTEDRIREFPIDRAKYFINELYRDWWPEIIKRLTSLMHLERGWDGYRGEPVSFENAHFALKVLECICSTNDPAPQIVPGSSGDLQIEWHTRAADVELHIIAPYDVDAWIANDEIGPDGEDIHLTTDFTAIVRQIRKMTERSSDQTTTA